jgi:hypothetical protein
VGFNLGGSPESDSRLSAAAADASLFEESPLPSRVYDATTLLDIRPPEDIPLLLADLTKPASPFRVLVSGGIGGATVPS